MSSSSTPEPQLVLNPFLSTTQRSVSEGIFSHILWDLREHPVPFAQLVQQLGTSLSQAILSESATVPPVSFLQITCEYPDPWNIVVLPSVSPRGSPSSLPSLHNYSPGSSSSSSSSPPRARQSYVTVYDVLRAIHADLLLPVRPEELAALADRQRGRVMEAFERRWKTSINPSPEDACRAGVKKVDTLMQHTLFGGLSVDLDQSNTCILSLRRPT